MQLPLDNSILTNTQAAEVKKYQQLAADAVETQNEQLYSITEVQDVITTQLAQPPTFLSITSRNLGVNGNSWILNSLGYEDVISGAVEDEIQAVVSETESIAAAMNVAKREINYAAVPTVNVTNYGGGGTTECSATTSTAGVAAAIEKGNYNKTYGSGKTAQQYKAAVVEAFDQVLGYLDNLIANYNTRVAQGMAAGHQEVKLTTLLQLRNAIRNCDLPINIEDTYNQDVDYGAYYAYRTAVYIVTDVNGNQYEAVEGTADDYDEIVSGTYIKFVNRNLDRHYTREICFTTDTLDSFMVSNYQNPYFLSTIIHEFTHSLHIPNETVAYLMGEILADDSGYILDWGDEWANASYNYGNSLDSDHETLYFGDWWEHTSQGSVNVAANASEFANYTADPNFDKNAAINKRFTA